MRNNWRNAARDPVANMELWQRLLAAAKPHEVEWRWVRGHAGDAMNERADGWRRRRGCGVGRSNDVRDFCCPMAAIPVA